MTDVIKFNIGQEVWLKLDPEKKGFITGITFRPSGHSYLVTWGTDEVAHYEFELCSEPFQVENKNS